MTDRQDEDSGQSGSDLVSSFSDPDLIHHASEGGGGGADWLGSRGEPGDRPTREWNTPPKSNWWQYKCPIDGEFFQMRDMPTYPVFCRSEKHKIRVRMDLVHDPTKE